jgi:capsular polysaccharide biosynthesis protein
MLLEKQRVKEKLSGKMTRKLVVNEADAESLFASRGFQIVAPETLPFEAQIMLIGNASHVAGLAGSALHMILFNGQPETKLIELSSRYVRNQIIINALRRVEGHHIFCVNQLDETARPVLDIERIADTLDHIL